MDSSQVVLDLLDKYVQKKFKELPNGRLTLVCSEMETYQFPEDVRLIYGNSFPYCDPAQFERVWQRAYLALEKGGRVVGEFFPYPSYLTYEIFRLTGAWFIDTQTAKAFLDHQGYRREFCENDKYWYQSGAHTINFMGQKPI